MRPDGARIRAARQAAKLSPSDLAARMHRCGMTATTAQWVDLVEARSLTTSEPILTCLAAALGVGLTDILPAEQATGILIVQVAEDLAELADQIRETGLTMMAPRAVPDMQP